MKRRIAVLGAGGVLLLLPLLPLRGQDPLPAELSNDTFWRMVTGFSEAGGSFRYENLLSNEASYQQVIPTLKKIARPGGAYIGVGPEQNFTYIAAIEPRIAFIVDIRRQNMLELLTYKALFEMSIDRADFLSRLFSRERPAGLGPSSSIEDMFNAYATQSCDRQRFAENLKGVDDRLIDGLQLPLTSGDQKVIQHVLETFCAGGPQIDYGFVNAPSNLTAPSYAELMTATDKHGRNWSYLANEDNFTRIREMQLKNLIVPLVGDFAGGKTLRSVAAYLKQHNLSLTAFYVSNVEQYLRQDQEARFRSNAGFLPTTPLSAIIRFTPPDSTGLETITDFLARRAVLFHLLNSGDSAAAQPQ